MIALTCDNIRILRCGDQSGIQRIMDKAEKFNISPERVHIDPMVMALSADNQSMMKFLETLKVVKELYPSIKITSGLSNISFGMPLRQVINQNFLTIAVSAGMDSAIMDPLDRKIMTALMATEALLGRDRHCRKFLNAYRKNQIGPKRN